MWVFLVEANLCSFIPDIFFISVTSHSPDFRQMSWFFVLNEKVRGDCLFCWYWLNYWPSLFKFSFHNFNYIVYVLPLTVNLLILQRMSFRLFVIYFKYTFKTNLMAFIFKVWYNREYSHLSATWLDNRNILVDIPFSMYIALIVVRSLWPVMIRDAMCF